MQAVIHSPGFIQNLGKRAGAGATHTGSIECMFEEQLPTQATLAAVDDAALIDAISGWTRREAAAAAHRWAAIAELTDRRCHSELAAAREQWACDAWDSAAAEIAAAQTISHRAASKQMHQGLALRHRLPMVAALLAAGDVSPAMAATLTWRAHLVDDPEVLAAVDADLAEAIDAWGRLAPAKLQTKVDALIERHDPAAVLAHQDSVRGRDVRVGKEDDVTGTTSLWGRLMSTDGELLERRLDAMARSVCPTDPRSLGERRSDALGIVLAGGEALPCRCEQRDCPNAGRDARADAIVIHVLTNHEPDAADPPTAPEPPTAPDPPTAPEPPTAPDPSTAPDAPMGPADLDGPTAPAPTGEDPPPTSTGERPSTTPESEPPAGSLAPFAMTTGGGVVPAPLLAELRRIGAAVRYVPAANSLTAEAGYRPSTLMARFVRTRDTTCCYPGCNHPAERCDLDHSISYATSRLTHPGNLKCLCRKHHLLRTFWIGVGGWHDEQLADGTVIWVAPTGHRYRTPPGSRLHFPDWDTTTPAPPLSAADRPSAGTDRGLAMPVRKRPRAAERAARIRCERNRNQDAIDANAPPF